MQSNAKKCSTFHWNHDNTSEMHNNLQKKRAKNPTLVPWKNWFTVRYNVAVQQEGPGFYSNLYL